jgi:hypothetical protein
MLAGTGVSKVVAQAFPVGDGTLTATPIPAGAVSNATGGLYLKAVANAVPIPNGFNPSFPCVFYYVKKKTSKEWMGCYAVSLLFFFT